MKKITTTALLLAVFSWMSYSQDTTATSTQSKNRPKATYKVGDAEVAVWENEKGKSFKVVKNYKLNGKWVSSSYFKEEDLLNLKEAVEKAIAGEKK